MPFLWRDPLRNDHVFRSQRVSVPLNIRSLLIVDVEATLIPAVRVDRRSSCHLRACAQQRSSEAL